MATYTLDRPSQSSDWDTTAHKDIGAGLALGRSGSGVGGCATTRTARAYCPRQARPSRLNSSVACSATPSGVHDGGKRQRVAFGNQTGRVRRLPVTAPHDQLRRPLDSLFCTAHHRFTLLRRVRLLQWVSKIQGCYWSPWRVSLCNSGRGSKRNPAGELRDWANTLKRSARRSPQPSSAAPGTRCTTRTPGLLAL